MLGFPYKVCNSVFTQNLLEFFYVYEYVLEKRGQEKFQLSLSLFYKNKVFKRHVDKKVSEKTVKKFEYDSRLKADLIRIVNLNSTYLNFHYYFKLSRAEPSRAELSRAEPS